MKRKSAKPRQRHRANLRATLGFLRLELHAPELAGGAGGGRVVVYHEFCWKRRARLTSMAQAYGRRRLEPGLTRPVTSPTIPAWTVAASC